MPDFDWNIPLPLHFGQAETPQMSLARALPDEPLRPVFEAFIQQRFRKAHGADIRQFMPELFGMNDASGELCAVAGVRLASREPLFLERYLDEPIDPLISAAADCAVDRRGIVEVG
ncbi:MAG: thermostable hemolysin, partial [Pseudomonas sp.]